MTEKPLDLAAELRERFAQLPKVVQDAINSSHIEENLRKLADGKSLHVDQWQTLENEVMLAVLGFQPAVKLEDNLRASLKVTPEIAHELAVGVNNIVFEPIRQELERELQHPDAKAAAVSGTEAARTEAISQEAAAAAPAPTPAAPKPETTAARAPASGAYKPGEPSSQRKAVADDPYREPPL